MGRLPDLVRDSKLETQPGTHGDTIHIFRDPSRQRRTTERERWRYKSLVGHGGGGVVWLQEKVTKRSTSASVETRAVKAIKVDEPHEPKSTHQLSIAEQYVRELEALAKFSQRKLRNSTPILLYSSMGGGSKLNKPGPLPADEAQEITAQVLGGLCYMHEEGFAHRDLKPKNILIKSCPPDRWWTVICDHGLSKRVEDDATITTIVKGTPKFISPERLGFLEGIVPKEADPYAADMWCLGETAFQILCGQSTFPSDDMLRKFVIGSLEFPTDCLRNAKVGDHAIEFVTSIMQAQPSRRLTCFQARGHIWMTLDKSREPPSPELDAHSLSNSEPDLYTDDLQEREQPLEVNIPVSQHNVIPTTSTESSRAWSPVTQSLEDPFSELSSSGADPIGSLPDFSMNDSITTKVDTTAKPKVNRMLTLTEFLQEGRDLKIRQSFSRLDVEKNADTSLLPGQILPSSDGSPAAGMPEEAPVEKPRKKAKENLNIKWTMNWKRLLRRIGSDTSIQSRKGTPTSTSRQATPQGSQEPDHGPGILQLHPAALPSTLPEGSTTAGKDLQSHASVGGNPLPESVTDQQSEQVPFFKDYYSQDDIHPRDKVAVLWAFQPRAEDEFALERGDMLYVVTLWDDGWGVGIMMDERVEEWEVQCRAQKDSGISGSSGQGRDSPPVSGEMKAFPLVCVCSPQHWRKTIEGDKKG
ncbi:hypothetical protein LZL87_014150 [Fusarium oxysporum]|nr:hypothetical protein LZL87_014150 [Fusarium oxysporum]